MAIKWCDICLIGVCLPVEKYQELCCTVDGVAHSAQAIEYPTGEYHRMVKVRVDGLQEVKGRKVTPNLFENIEIEFFVNMDGAAKTSVRWK